MKTKQKPMTEIRIIDSKYATIITRNFWHKIKFLWYRYRYPNEVELLEHNKVCVAIRTPADWFAFEPPYQKTIEGE